MLSTFFSDTSIFPKFNPYLNIQSFGRLSSLNKYFYQLSSQFQKELRIEIQHYLEGFSFEQRMEKLLGKRFRPLSTQETLEVKAVVDQMEDLGDIGKKVLSQLLIKVCAFTNSYVIAKLLLQKKADPRAADSKGFTALHYAALSNQENVCQLLIQAGADVNAQTIAGSTPLHLAAIRSNRDGKIQQVYRYLFNLPNTLRNLQDNQLKKAHDYYVTHLSDLPTDVKKLIFSQISLEDFKTIQNTSMTCKEFALLNNERRWAALQQTYPHHSPLFIFLEIFDLIQDPLEPANKQGLTKDLLAILHCSPIDVRTFCNRAVDNEEDVTGGPHFQKTTVLHLAAEYDFLLPVAKLILKKGADVNAKDWQGSTPLHHATAEENYNICKLLVAHGAEINALNDFGLTPLEEGLQDKGGDVEGNLLKITQLLLEKGANVQSNVILLNAVLISYDLCSFLLHHGADVNSRDVDQITPLHLAIFTTQLGICQLLVEHGANLNIEANGKPPFIGTPLAMATAISGRGPFQDPSHEEVYNYILSKTMPSLDE